MMNIKLNYLDILENINAQAYAWNVIHTMVINTRKFTIKTNAKGTNNIKQSPSPSGFVNVTTSDAFSLTDGPTIYIAEDVDKIRANAVAVNAFMSLPF